MWSLLTYIGSKKYVKVNSPSKRCFKMRVFKNITKKKDRHPPDCAEIPAFVCVALWQQKLRLYKLLKKKF